MPYTVDPIDSEFPDIAAPAPHPVLLCVPGVDGVPQEHRLPLADWRYKIDQQADHWRVTVHGTGELVYAGPGPVDIKSSPAPF